MIQIIVFSVAQVDRSLIDVTQLLVCNMCLSVLGSFEKDCKQKYDILIARQLGISLFCYVLIL